MRFAIVYSKLNIAGINIVERFRELAYTPHVPIIELKKETLYYDDLDEKNYPELKGIDFLIFASTHRSEKGHPSLSLHAPGNWRSQKLIVSDDSQNSERILKNADLGGQVGKVSKTSSFVLKYLFQELNKNYNENKEKLNKEYNITLEVTHHGPSIELPCCYIELGSSENEWNDKEAARIIAKTILSLEDYSNTHIDSWQAAIGIGGPHYAPIFNKIQLNSKYAIGHIIPEYSLPLTESMLKEAEQKTRENIKEIIIDWKGCGKSEQRQEIINIIEKLGLKFKRTNEIEK